MSRVLFPGCSHGSFSAQVVTVKIREKGGPWMLADTSTDPATLVHKGGKAVPGHLTYVRVRSRGTQWARIVHAGR